MLEALGLDRLDEALYTALLDDPDLDAESAARRLGRPVADVVAAWRRLADKGLIRRSLERPGRCYPVHPEVGLGRLIAEREVDLARQQAEVAAAREAAAQVARDYLGSRAWGTGDLEVIKDVDSVRDRLAELARRAVKDVLTMHPGAERNPAALEESLPHDLAVLARGAAMRDIYAERSAAHRPTARYARRITEAGAQVRVAPLVPVQMIVIDHSLALLPLEATAAGSGALLTRIPGLVDALVALFERCWEEARPFFDATPRQPLDGRRGATPTAFDRALLGLMAEGATNEAAARQLGVSLRTLHRRLAHLMEELGAESRFQAGAHAVARGWIAPAEAMRKAAAAAR
jgi:sugar-specific transcriptional regulator TrmB/DNA-binding CsgD family transcriptional regulator